MQTSVREVVCEMGKTPRECHVSEEDEATDAYHDMEDVFIRVPHQHRHVMLLHSLRNHNYGKDHAEEHEHENVGLAEEHVEAIDVVAYGLHSPTIGKQVDSLVVAQIFDIGRNEKVQVVACILRIR